MADEEKKVYPTVGTVTISTEEYRDLIEGVSEAKRERDKRDSDYWRMYRECNEKEDVIKKQKEEIESLKKFAVYIWSDEARKNAYKLYLAEQKVAELEEGGEC